MSHHRHPPIADLLTCTMAYPFRDDTGRDVDLVAVSSPSMFPAKRTWVAAVLLANAMVVVRSPRVAVPDTEDEEDDLACNTDRPHRLLLVLVFVP